MEWEQKSNEINIFLCMNCRPHGYTEMGFSAENCVNISSPEPAQSNSIIATFIRVFATKIHTLIHSHTREHSTKWRMNALNANSIWAAKEH